MEKKLTLIDPYGLQIAIADTLCSREDAVFKKAYTDYQTVIENPAFIIDMREAAKQIRYYFRSVGWGTKLLIKVEKISSQWQANQCDKNPSDSFLHNLARQGNILSPSTGDQGL